MELTMIHRPATRLASARASLRAGCAAATVLLAASGSIAAHAKGFSAVGDVVQGSAQITTGARTTNIAVQTPGVVIDWREEPIFTEYPSDPGNDFPGSDFPISSLSGSGEFLPENSTATFTGHGAAGGGYTVLNRVFLSDPAEFNGTVESFLETGAPGGNIWFYSPNGMIVGSDARFNVGSLLLTTNQVELGNGTDTISLHGQAGSGASIDIRPGAQLNALSDNAYLALVAPAISQSGTLQANGSIALVAAEQAEIHINAGLLDIVVTEGTSDPNGILHDGVTRTTGGAAASAISFVAIPKNDALTMLLSGTIGYDAATQASADGTSIILSAGNGPEQPGSIDIGNANFNAPVAASASDAIYVAPEANGVTRFDAGGTLSAGRLVSLTGAEGGGIFASSLDLLAGDAGTGGTISMNARTSGRIAVDELTASADGRGEVAGGDGIGGFVELVANGGLLDLQSVSLSAAGIAGGSDGSAQGGAIRVAIDGEPQAWGDLTLDASARQGASASSAITAGSISMELGEGTGLSLAGDFSARAMGLTAGEGAGFSLNGGNSIFSVAGAADINSQGAITLTAPFDIGGALTASTPATFSASQLVSAGGGAAIGADLGITFTELESGGATVLDALSGPITTSGNLLSTGPVTARGASVDLLSSGSLSFDQFRASDGDGSVNVGGTLDVAQGMSASGALNLIAGGLVTLGGPVVGTTVTVRSPYLDISDGGQLGERGTTQSVLLDVTGANTTIALGDGVDGAYHLSAAEMARIFANESLSIGVASMPSAQFAAASFALATASSSDGGMYIGDLEMSFGNEGNLGSGGTLQLTSPGDVQVAGTVNLVTSEATDQLAIDGGQISILSDSGSIVMRDAAAALQGQLNLTADAIVAVDSKTLDADGVPIDPSMLDRPVFPPNTSGSLQAGQVALDVGDLLLIQNTGQDITYANRRGISANSLSITTHAANPLIIVNGQTFDSQGAPVRGLDTAQTILLNGAPAAQAIGLDAASSVNGCANGADCTPLEGKIEVPSSNVTAPADFAGALDLARGVDITESLGRSDDISVLSRNDTLQPEDTLGSIKVDGLLGGSDTPLLPFLMFFQQPDPARENPLLDQPVTGVGNDDLWQGACPDDSDCVPTGDSPSE